MDAKDAALALGELVAVPPAELGVLLRLRPTHRHLRGTVLDLGARGVLTARSVRVGTGWGAPRSWEVDVVPPAERPRGTALRRHEQLLLDLLAAVESGATGEEGTKEWERSVRGVLAAVRQDAVERGWLRDGLRGRLPLGPGRRTAAGRAALASLRTARGALEDDDLAAAQAGAGSARVVEVLPLAQALGVDAPWRALERHRPPVPAWFTPGPPPVAHGWAGLRSFADGVVRPREHRLGWVGVVIDLAGGVLDGLGR